MARSILFLLSALGFFGIFVAPIWNGMHELTGKHLASKTLPDGTPLSSNLRIGLPFAHVYLSHLIIFFWNLFRIDEIPGATVDSALLFVPFSGAILPITMIQLVEGVRLENRGTAVSLCVTVLFREIRPDLQLTQALHLLASQPASGVSSVNSAAGPPPSPSTSSS